MQECEDIKRQLPISSFLRPAWDLKHWDAWAWKNFP